MSPFISDFRFTVTHNPKIVPFPFGKHLLKSLVDFFIEVIEYTRGVLPAQEDILTCKHTVRAHNYPGSRNQTGSHRFVMTVPNSDHSAVAQASPTAQGDGAKETISSMGEQAIGVLNSVAVIPDLSFHPIHQFVVGQGSPA